ncbi:Asp23/Gls24 family envelope stress response protein [Aeromicrobium fastidiosum]|uniref:Asp23/Gls24 family envelope stress response protein n=1 Tax=Aeromicrobium fastidiosum TaxID=52699 RepID=A0A641AKD1_9ACTN|nr:Asp23/Gls24 family envelope stress response protein [Aeromicrobium fastidiosum]KAA1374885.1 Asp23/Gls24 family envelope stress response protein [Aeromicrobium fastidiosum]MBP2390549.1 putative alkaline shock family protein YloU [Aeromicrobium fastidiosum]
MADTLKATAPAKIADSGSASAELVKAAPTGPLVSDQGRTSIADAVVSKIAGIATREVSGVHDLGGNTARAVGAIRDRIPGSRTNLSQGVNVEVGERQAAVDVDLIAEYGVSIAELATGVRRNVIGSVERMTGLEVTEVNITVLDVHLEGDETDADTSESRVE